MKCYIVAIGEQTNCLGYDYEYHVFMTEEKAREYCNKVLDEYAEGDATSVESGLRDNQWNDLDDEWIIWLETAVLGE